VRKILVVAVREFKAAVRTKSFIVSLVLMPVLMGGGAAAQVFFKKQSSVQDKRFAIVDRTPGEKLFKQIELAAEKHNEAEKKVRETGKPTAPLFLLERVTPRAGTQEDIDRQRLELSQQVRDDKFFGFVDIGPDACKPPQSKPQPAKEDDRESPAVDPRQYLRYQTNHPTYEAFPSWVERQLILAIAREQLGLAGMTDKVDLNVQPIRLRREGLTELDPRTNKIVDPPIIQQVARFVIPAAFVALMFVIVMLASTPAMQGVVEEKMQRIAEVLLGSLRPFELMMGKLLGLMAVSFTVSAVYLAGAYWAAHYYDLTDLIPVPLIAWYIVFQLLAVLMYGSLFLAIGAAAADIKETQTLVMPVILVACIPMFILSTALEDPNNPVVVGTSFFPPVTPMLMLARIAIPPGPPWWQAVLAVALVLAVTTFCVYAAGRIFRVGILMQGKGARLGQLLAWVFRG
jgi:ABC-2 type transport system permease protein